MTTPSPPQVALRRIRSRLVGKASRDSSLAGELCPQVRDKFNNHLNFHPLFNSQTLADDKSLRERYSLAIKEDKL